ncbi:hypothetical protein WBP07_18170 [Novosphingobium sp. BL-8A]|uniref:hypothetical protein n=1 Tax=Novosphingobium sp. BL-8A TaxID=3127639 RepID=UPI0037577005
MTDTRTEHTPEAIEAEPDMSWFDIAVTHNKEVMVLGHSEDWNQFDIEHWWEDTFATCAPEHLAPGAYRWAGYLIGSWDEGEHLNVTGGDFTPLLAGSPAEPVAWLYIYTVQYEPKMECTAPPKPVVALSATRWDKVPKHWAETPLYARPAKAIEARRAETGTGSVHESAVPQAFAQTIPGDSA